MAEWKGVLLPGGRLELMVKPRGATPTTLVSLLIDHIVAKASTIFPYCMPIRFSEAIHSTISMENRSSIFLSHLISVIRKQGIILYIIHSLFVGWNIERIIVVSRKMEIFHWVLLQGVFRSARTSGTTFDWSRPVPSRPVPSRPR